MERLSTYDDPLRAARLYAEAFGWRVVPCRKGSKVPAVKEWTRVATTDPNQIESWWRGPFAGHGVCIATGDESNLLVVDVDVANGKQGLQTLQELLRQHGRDRAVETYTVRTPSGGMHLYLRYPNINGVIRNDAGRKLGPGLDIRAEGGQVVAPPTPGYAWIDGRAPWELDIDTLPGSLW
jgi:hypothetical protein